MTTLSQPAMAAQPGDAASLKTGDAPGVDLNTDAKHEPHRAHIRSPVDVLRLIVGAIAIVIGIGSANLLDSALLGLSDDGTTAIAGLPDWIRNIPSVGLAVAVVAAISGALAWSLLTTRFRRFALLSIGLGLAAAASVSIGHLIEEVIDGDVLAAFQSDKPLFRYSNEDGRIHPGDPLLAGSVAMLTLSGSYLRRAATRRLGALVGLYAAISTLSAGVPALGLISDVGAGLVVGSLILLIFGRHDLAPQASEIQAAMASVGVELATLDQASVDARGSTPWFGTTRCGERVFVKTLGRDERSADLLFRAVRWIRLRKAGDHRPFDSLRRAVEHEALVSFQARALGIQTPEILGVADAGVDGMALAYKRISGRSADSASDISDEALVTIWTMVSQLHQKRIAHRDLRLANIFIGDDGAPWLIDFGFSELAASDQLLGTDVAELLASTAAVVGVERAVGAAHRATGLDELERALPWLQPLALSSATRQAIDGDKGLKPIRTILIEQCGVPAEDPVRLQRLNPKSLFVAASVVLSAWFLIPQLADIDNIWQQARTASIAWASAAVGFSMLTYIAATAALLGAIPLRLRFRPAFLAQLASSFANRVTPAKVGGVAVNIRYFQRQGVPAVVGVTAVGLNAIAGLIMHVTLTVGFLLLASSDENSTGLPIPSPAALGVGAAAAVTIIGTSLALPLTRRLLIEHVVPQLKAGLASITQIRRSPGRLLLLLGGSATITLAYLLAMYASLEAFGSTAAFPLVGLLFLTGSVVANAAPTPGGLGAAEAAFIAAFSTVEEASIVIPAVFLYRLVTFWLPIVPGWAALTYLRQADEI